MVLTLWHDLSLCHWITTTGTSMVPLIQTGDRLWVEHKLGGIRRGSIVVFWRDGQLMAHRVLSSCPGSTERWWTKGDNTDHCDPPVAIHELVGRVLAVQHGARCIELDAAYWRALGWCVAAAGRLACAGEIALTAQPAGQTDSTGRSAIGPAARWILRSGKALTWLMLALAGGGR
jgi:hypothetical protein